MGAIFAERVLGIANPRVALLSIGEEKGKGDKRIHDATELLDQSGLNFVGNVEGKDLTGDLADVDDADAVVDATVVDRHDVSAAEREDVLHAFVGECARDDLTTVELSHVDPFPCRKRRPTAGRPLPLSAAVRGGKANGARSRGIRRVSRLGSAQGGACYRSGMSERTERIAARLTAGLDATSVEIVDDSARHAGHAGARGGGVNRQGGDEGQAECGGAAQRRHVCGETCRAAVRCKPSLRQFRGEEFPSVHAGDCATVGASNHAHPTRRR